jgi:hypothetical protein
MNMVAGAEASGKRLATAAAELVIAWFYGVMLRAD